MWDVAVGILNQTHLFLIIGLLDTFSTFRNNEVYDNIFLYSTLYYGMKWIALFIIRVDNNDINPNNVQLAKNKDQIIAYIYLYSFLIMENVFEYHITRSKATFQCLNYIQEFFILLKREFTDCNQNKYIHETIFVGRVPFVLYKQLNAGLQTRT